MHDSALFVVGRHSSLRVSSANCILLTTLSPTRHTQPLVRWGIREFLFREDWVLMPGETTEMLPSRQVLLAYTLVLAPLLAAFFVPLL